MNLVGVGQREGSVGAGQQVPVRRGDVDVARLDSVPLFSLLDVQVRMASQDMGELAREVRGEVLDNKDGRGEVGGQGGQDKAEGLQATRRGSDGNDAGGDREPSGQVSKGRGLFGLNRGHSVHVALSSPKGGTTDMC